MLQRSGDQGGLAHVRGLAAHVRSADQPQPVGRQLDQAQASLEKVEVEGASNGWPEKVAGVQVVDSDERGVLLDKRAQQAAQMTRMLQARARS